MSYNKNALLRYRLIDKLLSDVSGKSEADGSPAGVTVDMLAEECAKALSEVDGKTYSVSRVTIYDDIKTLENDWHVTIEKTQTRPVRYYYPVNGVTMNGKVLSYSDYSDLAYSLEYLESVSGLLQVDRTVDKIHKRLGDLGSEKRKLICFESAPKSIRDENKDGKDMLWRLYRFIREGKPLNISYNRAFVELKDYDFQPMYLKQYAGRWHLMGWKYAGPDEVEGDVRDLAVDRIKDVKVNRSRMMRPQLIRRNDIDFDEYFKDIIGMHKLDVPVETIVLKVDLKAGKRDFERLRSKPIHASQTERRDGDYGYVTIRVRPNPELYSTMARFPDIVVESPGNVRDEFVNYIKHILEHYE